MKLKKLSTSNLQLNTTRQTFYLHLLAGFLIFYGLMVNSGNTGVTNQSNELKRQPVATQHSNTVKPTFQNLYHPEEVFNFQLPSAYMGREMSLLKK